MSKKTKTEDEQVGKNQRLQAVASLNDVRDCIEKLHGVINLTKHVPATTPPSAVTRAEAALSILVILHVEQQATLTAIVKRIGLDKSNVSRHIKRLIEEGYMSKSGDDTDKRLHVIRLTDSGAALAQAMLDSLYLSVTQASDTFSTVAGQLQHLILRSAKPA